MTLLIARETTTDGVAADIDLLSGFEVTDGDRAAQLESFKAIDAVLAQVTQQGVAGFVEVTLGGLVDQLLAGFPEADLHRGIAIGVVVFELGDAAGAGLDQGDGDRFALLVEELGHAQFLPEDAD